MNEPSVSSEPLTIMVCAGEVSGDLYGAALVRELRALSPRPLRVFGIGGDRMREEGVELLEHVSRTGVMGFVEVFRRAPFLHALYKRLVRALDERKPRLLLTIDYPGMNLRLAAKARARGIPAVQYVCPQVWAWRKGRIPRIAASLDRLVALFPFEPALFEGTGLRVDFLGHPLVDQIAAFRARPLSALPWKEGRRVALLAGSRRSEVLRILPTLLAGARLAEGTLGPCSFLLPVPDEARAADVRAVLAETADKPERVDVVVGESRAVLASAEAAVVKSGTSTLEATLLGCPFFLVYRTAPLTYLIIRHLARGLRFIGLVNIVAGREVCPELIQDAFTPEAVRDQLVALLSDGAARAAIQADLAAVSATLGEPGATHRAAEAIAGMLPA